MDVKLGYEDVKKIQHLLGLDTINTYFPEPKGFIIKRKTNMPTTFIYRHKQNERYYTLQHLRLDPKFAGPNKLEVIYAIPYTCPGAAHDPQHVEILSFKSRDLTACTQYVTDNFERVAELYHY